MRSRATCEKHKITLRSDGVCMLCRKELLENKDANRGWQILLAVMILAVISGSVIAALI